MKKRKRFLHVSAVILSAVFLAACGKAEETVNEREWLAYDTDDRNEEEESGEAVTTGVGAVNITEPENLFTDRDLRGDYSASESVEIILSEGEVKCDSQAVFVNDNNVTITKEGVYLLSGTLQEGMITVDVPDTDKVQLVFAGVSVFNSSNGALYVKSADKIFITLAEGTVNRLENGGGYTDLDGNHIDGVIFAKCDVTVNGSGSLEITAAEGHGIVTKDDLKITGGSLLITAAGHGLSGKDSVLIAEGTISVVSGRDGIHSEHDTNPDKGYVYIKDGEFTITAEGDGISAGKTLQIDGGSFVITTGGGSTNRTLVRDSSGETVSTKGFKSGEGMVINGGVFVMDTQDDGFHSNDAMMINGGEFQVATGDDGFHADETITIADGFIEISESYEGIEGNNVVISGGQIRLVASDDGINAAGGNDQSGFGGFFGRDGFGGGTDSSLLISGGIVYVNADGDGVDSNGTLMVTGGELYISGPVNSSNGALDYESMGQITGGIVVAAGNGGMAMNFGDTSTQGSVLITVPSQTAGTEIAVKDSEGNVLISYTAEKAFNSVVFSCPEMVLGGTYTLTAGESEQSVTLENLIYGFGGFGGRGGMGGFGGPGDHRGGGNFGEQRELPEGMDFGDPGDLPEGMDPGCGDRGPGGRGEPGEFGEPGELPEGMDPGNGDRGPGGRGEPGEFGGPEEPPEGMDPGSGGRGL